MEITPPQVRAGLADALELDLVGPRPRVDAKTLGDLAEILPQAPRAWYLTGFLIPIETKSDQKVDPRSDEDLEGTAELGGAADDTNSDPPSGRQRILPSSFGLTVIVPPDCQGLSLTVRWGDYKRDTSRTPPWWHRHHQEQTLSLDFSPPAGRLKERPVPQHPGLKVSTLHRLINLPAASGIPAGARAVSVFLVNRREAIDDEDQRDEAFTFQTELTLTCPGGFLGRPDLRGLDPAQDWDERVADLQYRDDREYATGHNVATAAHLDADGCCRTVSTTWLPCAQVERVAPTEPQGIPPEIFRMEFLAKLTDSAALTPLVAAYREWIKQQSATPGLSAERSGTATTLLAQATAVATRMERGIAALADPVALSAFQMANEAMATSARRRAIIENRGVKPEGPIWRPFQLAFILLNIVSITDPTSTDRDFVDLLFFPTGGGKTEAYLGLSAFTLILRRLKNPSIASAGVAVLMRYTLRLLTLDQLGRASTLICALELIRIRDVTKLGKWPFEIGLWVGAAATPNKMGGKGEPDDTEKCARRRTLAYLNQSTKDAPLPIEDCPWCGRKFEHSSYRLLRDGRLDKDNPSELRLRCANPDCAFTADRYLPILAVDDMIYRRLPCFLIATVDKFAALPYTGQVGYFFGKVSRYDREGFYGAMDTGDFGHTIPEPGLSPPDLIIQDELHLISGPLGTLVGLYEAALEKLCTRGSGKPVLPKIVASTATVRKAASQIQALFGRHSVDIFPPPGPNRRDSFFAETVPPTESAARLYIGVAAQGRSPKVVQLRVYLALLSAAQRAYEIAPHAADPYITLLGYFNALRELGGTRRLIEDEVYSQLANRSQRRRIHPLENLFADRKIGPFPVELTSRASSTEVAQAKRRLSRPFSENDHVDIALATNMISVGLDITRLGLLVVYGQPKTTAEYIQATSRVGRDFNRPGLVVTILNPHKPRDRSHYERFAYYHETFYRSVEASSVTPYSPRALDRGLAGVLVSLMRHSFPIMAPAQGVQEISRVRHQTEPVIRYLAERASGHRSSGEWDHPGDRQALSDKVARRCQVLLDLWEKVNRDLERDGVGIQYNQFEYATNQHLLRDFLSPELKDLTRKDWRMYFRANRSLRDVEPVTNIHIIEADGTLDAGNGEG